MKKKIHYTTSRYRNPLRPRLAMGRPKIRVGKFDAAGHLVQVYSSMKEAAKAEGLATIADRIQRGTVVDGMKWRKVD